MTLAFESGSVAHKCRRALDTLLKTVLLDKALDFLLEFLLLGDLLLFHLRTTQSNIGLVFLSSRWLLSIDISVEPTRDRERTSFRLKSWVDILVGLVHMLA